MAFAKTLTTPTGGGFVFQPAEPSPSVPKPLPVHRLADVFRVIKPMLAPHFAWRSSTLVGLWQHIRLHEGGGFTC